MNVLGCLTSKLHILPKNTNVTQYNTKFIEETITNLYLTLVHFRALQIPSLFPFTTKEGASANANAERFEIGKKNDSRGWKLLKKNVII